MNAAVRRRLPGLRIKAGTVRRAREEAGLSLAGVARSDVSRTAIFLIETGKSRPTLPTLELIAERTGKDLEFFLEEVDLQVTDFTEIERWLATDQLDLVIELTTAMLSTQKSRADMARLRFLKGQAHIRMADLDAGEPLLRSAREHYEGVGDGAMAVECLSWEVHVPYLREEAGALDFARAALQACRELRPVPLPTEVRILARIAGIHAQNREWSEAIKVYEEAVELLGPVRDLHRLAAVYNDLGMAYRELGQLSLATRYSQKSLALHEILNDQRSLAMAENNLALALMNTRNYAAAQGHLERAMAIYDGLGVERGKSHVLLSMSELHLERGALGPAKDYGRQGLELAARLGEHATEAEAHLWLGRVAAASGDDTSTDREFETAIALLEHLGLGERLIRAHSAYAELLEERGDLAAAHHHLKQVVASSRPDLLKKKAAAGAREQLA